MVQSYAFLPNHSQSAGVIFINKRYIMEFLWYVIIGLAAGFIAGKIMRGSSFGFFINLLVGILGGVLGGWVFSLLGISSGGGIIGGLITSVIGAVLLLWVVNLVNRRQ